MTALVWDTVGQRFYETGVDHGVLYLADPEGAFVEGFAWNGLTTVTESPTGAEITPTYADNIKYLNLISVEEFGATIEAYTYPNEFAECDGSAQPETGVSVGQQPRRLFGLCYRTRVGNDLEGTSLDYKLHLIYNCLASPSEKAYASINDSPEAINFSWEVSTTPVPVTDYAPTASMIIDSTLVDSAALATLEDFLYGTVGTDPSLPQPDAVIAIFAGSLTLATPGVPTYDSGTDLVTIPGTTGVVYKINGVTKAAGTHAITDDVIVRAYPATGYKFPAIVADEWFFNFA